MSVIGSNVLAGASGQSAGGGAGGLIPRSLRFNSGDDSYLSRQPSTASDRKKWTWAGWVKRSRLGGNQSLFTAAYSANETLLVFDNSNRLVFWNFVSGSYAGQKTSTAVFRDCSAWYHIVLVWDSGNSTAADRIKIYVNGTRIDTFSTSVDPAQNTESIVNDVRSHRIGDYSENASYNLDGYQADVHFIDGQALAPTDFGETNTDNLWVPKAFAGTYGPLVDQSRTWSNDASGGSYDSGQGIVKAFNGDTTGSSKVAAAYPGSTTISFSPAISGNTIEFLYGKTPGTGLFTINGTEEMPATASATSYVWNTSSATTVSSVTINHTGTGASFWVAIKVDGKLLVDSGVSIANNSFHLDFADNSTNAALGLDTSGLSPANTWTVNNLSSGAIASPTAKQNFDVALYTGTGSSNSIGGLSFQPDFVWIKGRSAGNSHVLYDSVRGAGQNKSLMSNGSSGEGAASDDAQYGYLASFDTNGFTVAGGTSSGYANTSGATYAAWCWKAGGAASSNTDGTITSSVSVNVSHGFSIARYTGTGANASFGHGLSTAPKYVIVKDLSNSYGWTVWHAAMTGGEYFVLNTTAGKGSSTTVWNSTVPSSSVITVGTDVGTNKSGDNYVCYSWSEVAGFSKFGSWNGNSGSTTVTFGFKPRFVLWKSESATNWHMIDSARGVDQHLYPNEPSSEANQDYYGVDFTDTGITINSSYGDVNASGSTYLYMAFAETVPADPDSDSLVDTPTNGDTASDTGAGGEVVGNYATLNPLNSTSTTTLSDGNLAISSGGGWGSCMSTVAFTGGKFYYETTVTASNFSYIGASLTTHLPTRYPSEDVSWALLTSNGYCYYDQGGSNSIMINTGTTVPAGAVVGTAIDADNGKIWWSVNGSWIGSGSPNPATGSDPIFTNIPTDQALVACLDVYGNSATVNFGQRAFAYPLSGYKALCTANLPEPTIADGSKYFDTKLYSGDGTNGRAITGLNYSPDLVWIKARNQADGHNLFDIVRGTTKVIKSNNTNAELTESNSLTAFNSDGFTVGSNASNAQVNASGFTYAAGAWDAGSSNTTIAAGGLNSSLYNQAEAWNSQVTGTSQSYDFGGGGARGNNYIFDGDIKHASSALSGNTITWTGSIAFTSSFAIASDNDGADSSVNPPYNAVNITHGPSNTITNVRSQLPNTANSQLAAGTIPLTVLTGITSPVTKIECVGGTQGANGLTQVVADGRMLVDSGITLANVPSIASTVRANPSAGFSVITADSLTANTEYSIGHSLNAVPQFIIGKNRAQASQWDTYHVDVGAGQLLRLNGTGAATAAGSNDSNFSTTPTDSVFYFKANGATNNYVFYCFSPVKGYSSVGSYVGNGSADGPFVFLGFKPAWIMIRPVSGGNWAILDTARDPDNGAGHFLFTNDASAELDYSSSYPNDILSNGFKVRNTGGQTNTNGQEHIYLAFASNPFASNGGLAR